MADSGPPRDMPAGGRTPRDVSPDSRTLRDMPMGDLSPRDVPPDRQPPPDCLSLRDVSAGYGETVVLDGVSLALAPGGTLSVLGRNGVGKTTLLASVLGHTTLHAGQIAFAGRPLVGLRAFRRARLGIGYVPQEREIFPSLTVEENLTVAARPKRDGWTLERVHALFPRLAERRHSMGNQLSGGEQQMLAVGRALMLNPSLLLLDEPLEGLAPVMVDRLLDALLRLRAEAGLAMLLVEQQARLALAFSPRAAILDRGKVVYDGASQALLDDPHLLASLIGPYASPAEQETPGRSAR